MLILAHLGIGKAIVSPLQRIHLFKDLFQANETKWIYLGCVLPDLIDKPLYYGLSFLTGKRGFELGMIAGTRSFGHTALFLILLSGIAVWKKSRPLSAVSLGIFSHLVLDLLASYLLDSVPDQANIILLWPLKRLQMPQTPFHGLYDHIQKETTLKFLIPELIGAGLLSLPFITKKLIPSHSK